MTEPPALRLIDGKVWEAVEAYVIERRDAAQVPGLRDLAMAVQVASEALDSAEARLREESGLKVERVVRLREESGLKAEAVLYQS